MNFENFKQVKKKFDRMVRRLHRKIVNEQRINALFIGKNVLFCSTFDFFSFVFRFFSWLRRKYRQALEEKRRERAERKRPARRSIKRHQLHQHLQLAKSYGYT